MRIYNVFISWMREPVIWKWRMTPWSDYWPVRQDPGSHHPLETWNRYAQGCWCPRYLVFRIDSCWIYQGSQPELAISVGSPPRIIQLMINLVSRYSPPGRHTVCDLEVLYFIKERTKVSYSPPKAKTSIELLSICFQIFILRSNLKAKTC